MKRVYFNKSINDPDFQRERSRRFTLLRKYIVVIFISFGFWNAFSQQEDAVDKKTLKEINKKQRIEQRVASEEQMTRIVDSMINTRKFVLEAHLMSNQTGYRVNVNSMLNFIIVDSSDVTIQIASSQGIGGSNGIGGVTTNGNISKFDVKKSDNGYYTIMLRTLTTLGFYDIFLNISPSSNTDATITGITSGKLNYHGVIKPLEKSKIFKGRTI